MLCSAISFQIIFIIFLQDATTTRFQYITDASLANIYNSNVIRYKRQNENTCPNTKFKCDSGQCIEDIQLCDGNGDCDDNSDENLKVCKLENCPNSAFRCNYGACIHMNGRCNGLRDCFDGSDEESCEYTVKNAISSVMVGCQLPYNPPHGYYVVINHLSVEYNPGDIVPVFGLLSLNCKKGYVINPPEDESSSYCLPTGVWAPALKKCARMSLFSRGCRLPNNPQHGKYIVINHLSAGYKSGDVVPVYSLLSVVCKSGYVINPIEDDQPSYCLPTDEWIPAPKTCALTTFRSEGCIFPNNPLHGKYYIVNHLSYEYNPGNVVPVHSLLSLNCTAGYEVNLATDDKPSNCLSGGKWTPAPKTCQLMPFRSEGCIFPNNPSHGKYFVINQLTEYNSGDAVPVHSLLSLNCTAGYEVNLATDDKPSKCLSTGDWTHMPKSCEITRFVSDVCIIPGNPLHGKYVLMNHLLVGYKSENTVPVHSYLFVSCNQGYEVNPLLDERPSHCLPTGEWFPAPKTCSTIISSQSIIEGCIYPSNPGHGKYILNNNKSFKYNSGDIVPVNSSISTNCTVGYQIYAPPQNDQPSICLDTGKWYPDLLTCEGTYFLTKGCRVPYKRSHGRYFATKYSSSEFNFAGAIVPVYSLLFLKCEDGYEVNTPGNVTVCSRTGEWTPAPQTCSAAISQNSKKGCIFPSNPLNGQYSVISHLFPGYIPGDIVPVHGLLFLYCIKGYRAIPATDDNPSICLSTGDWTPTPKTCLMTFPMRGCIIPSNPPHGNYVFNNNLSSEYVPGDVVPLESTLALNCTTGYAASPPEHGSLSYCESTGKWVPSVKTCARACPSLTSTETTNVLCEFDGKPIETCSNAVENTVAQLSCSPFYEEDSMEEYPTRLCKDGNWNYPVPQCYPICGKIEVPGPNATSSRYHWHVGVYISKKPYRYKCGGSLISQRIVLSAARCFTDDFSKLRKKEDFVLAAGKYYRQYDDERDVNAQYSNIHDIIIPVNFEGQSNNFESDIAIIVLGTPFQLTGNVQPVCIALQNKELPYIIHQGLIPAWNVIIKDKAVSNTLTEKTVQLVNYQICEKKLQKDSKLFTNDKLCGKYLYNVKLAEKLLPDDIGDGLALPRDFIERYFIEGIRSTNLPGSESDFYGLFTDVTTYYEFIIDSVKSN